MRLRAAPRLHAFSAFISSPLKHSSPRHSSHYKNTDLPSFCNQNPWRAPCVPEAAPTSLLEKTPCSPERLDTEEGSVVEDWTAAIEPACALCNTAIRRLLSVQCGCKARWEGKLLHFLPAPLAHHLRKVVPAPRLILLRHRGPVCMQAHKRRSFEGPCRSLWRGRVQETSRSHFHTKF
ncbi:hypothetical protein SRHO_G00116910 [Serrasalmus rhombeus]